MESSECAYARTWEHDRARARARVLARMRGLPHLFLLVERLPLEVPFGGGLALRLEEVLCGPISIDASRHTHVGRQARIRRVEHGVGARVVMQVVPFLVAWQPWRVDSIRVKDNAILLGLGEPFAGWDHFGDPVAIHAALAWAWVLEARETEMYTSNALEEEEGTRERTRAFRGNAGGYRARQSRSWRD